MAFERVYAIWDFYDGIRSGVADYERSPHYFEQEWNRENDDYAETFTLKSIDEDTLALVLEQWDIFRTWEGALQRGEVPPDTHPGLPGKRARYAELEAALNSRIAAQQPSPARVYAKFETLPNQHTLSHGVMRDVQVEWRHEA